MSVACTYRRAFFFAFLLSCIIQSAYPVSFRHIGVKDGLSQTSVMSIYQDELGRMWFGTEEGISLYNGKELIAFKHSEDSVISQNIPIGNMSFPIVGDKNGNIYFRSDEKLLHYDIKSERFSCLKSENVSTVYCKDSLVLVASSDTIYTWDNKKKTFNIFLKANIHGYNIQKIFIDSKNRLWIGTPRGLFLHNGHYDIRQNEGDDGVKMSPNDRRIIESYDADGFTQIIEGKYIFEIIEDSKSNIWIATRSSGIYRFSQDSVIKNFKHNPNDPNTIPHNQIRSFAEDNYGNIWIGTFRGLCRYNPATETFTTYTRNGLPGGLHHSSVFSTFKDMQGTIWAGTYYGGVHYFNPETDRFSFYSDDISRDDCLSHFFVGQMKEDENSNIWICTEGGGLNFFDRKTKTFRHFLSDKNKNSIAHNNLKCIEYSQKRNSLYIGTHMGGVSIYDIKNDVFHNFRDEIPDLHKIIGDVIINIKIYKEDTLIIQSRNGFFKIDLDNKKLNRLINSSESVINADIFFIDSDDYLWLENKLEIIRMSINNCSDIRFINKRDMGFGSFRVSRIFEDNIGRLFFGTLGSGLYQYDKKSDSFISFKAEQDLLLSNYCYDIAQTEQNELIISGDKGLSILNIDRKSLKEIDLNALLFSGINNGCGLLVCRNGEVFAAGIGGMTSFFDQEVFSVNKDYELYFSSLTINEEKILPCDKTEILRQTFSYTEKIVLSHRQNNFSISFASNNYINKHTEIQYEHKLEGFDKMWISGANIIYKNIPPGKYKLVVREKNTDDMANPKTISMDIVVRYAWYANPIAYTIYFIIAYLVFMFFIRLRHLRLRLITKLDAERKEKEQIEKLNQAKLQFFSNISHEFHTPLTLIIVQIERLLSINNISPFVYNKLLKVNKQAIHLQNLIRELLDFRKLEQGQVRLKVQKLNIIPFLKEIYLSFFELSSEQNIKYTFTAPETEEILCWFDPKQLQKVFYNLIFNAFKYTKPNGKIDVSISEENGMINIKVIDNGIGIAKSDLKKIFDNFYQADNTKYGLQKSPSAGIGLSFTKSILELHHGSISVESMPSYGSIFIVTLKKDNNHFSKNEIVSKEQCHDDFIIKDLDEKDVGGQKYIKDCEQISSVILLHDNNIEPPENQISERKAENEVDNEDINTEPERIDTNKKVATVLIVEDNNELLQILEDIIDPIYNTLSAHNGKEGLCIARKEKPDLIISDVMMPEMSGTEMCVAIKNDFDTCHIPVILLTALSSLEHNIYGLQHGADEYISKPFSEKMLITRCNNLIRNRLIVKNKFSSNIDFDIQSVSNNPIDQKFLDTINHIIEKNFDNPEFNVNILANKLNVSRSSLYSKFEALTGMTPNDYMLQRKLKKGSEMLKNNPELNISEISDNLGFGSPRYFSRCFKNQFGVAPADYKKN
jgi:Signal transduction histidine kinase